MNNIDDLEDFLNFEGTDFGGEIVDVDFDEMIKSPNQFIRKMGENLGKRCCLYSDLQIKEPEIFTLIGLCRDDLDYYYKLEKDSKEIKRYSTLVGIEFI